VVRNRSCATYAGVSVPLAPARPGAPAPSKPHVLRQPFRSRCTVESGTKQLNSVKLKPGSCFDLNHSLQGAPGPSAPCAAPRSHQRCVCRTLGARRRRPRSGRRQASARFGARPGRSPVAGPTLMARLLPTQSGLVLPTCATYTVRPAQRGHSPGGTVARRAGQGATRAGRWDAHLPFPPQQSCPSRHAAPPSATLSPSPAARRPTPRPVPEPVDQVTQRRVQIAQPGLLKDFGGRLKFSGPASSETRARPGRAKLGRAPA
jgi:hypothetical protein